MELHEALEAAKELIEDQEHWTQGVGYEVSMGVEKWCSLGALNHVTRDSNEFYFLGQMQLHAAAEALGYEGGVVICNDVGGHEDVMLMFKHAIAAVTS